VKDAPRRYAIRRLNPFLGVVQVLEIPGGRALSYDGREWELQVETERPEHTWGSIERTRVVRQFFRFGNWNAEQGLSRVPVNPILDIGAMLEASEQLLAALRGSLQLLPFPFEDRYEYWLLDRDRQPLALLASCAEQRFTEQIRPDRWQATLPTTRDFVSARLEQQAVANHDQQGARHHAEQLERQVRDTAGPTPHRCWYQRQPGADATPLDEPFEPLPDSAFPELPWRDSWTEPAQQGLVDDYLNWLAPRLLTLDSLSEPLRRRLERAACAQALLVADLHLLYPAILQHDLLDAARVEARLRRAAI
jgi:hypothetical protein